MTIYCSHLQLMMVLRGIYKNQRVPRVCEPVFAKEYFIVWQCPNVGSTNCQPLLCDYANTPKYIGDNLGMGDCLKNIRIFRCN